MKRLLEDPLHNEDTAKLLKFACWENWNFSQALIDLIIQNVKNIFVFPCFENFQTFFFDQFFRYVCHTMNCVRF